MTNRRLTKLTIVDHLQVKRRPEIEHEIATAITDILSNNVFDPLTVMEEGPYALRLHSEDQNIVFSIQSEREDILFATVSLNMRALRKVIRDYFMICESHMKALASSSYVQVETIDMARRGVHDEGSMELATLLHGQISVDFNTARRLFTLVCALQIGVAQVMSFRH